ncbi:aldose epimerase [Cellulomonas sp. APG4]|uniref:aldose 1-epimerase n=1 Tax=Cellulomonas sp. APG4 TaxID=1538656 RepID=UPI00137B76B7|nr:aldose epimerase [Cellulomonas sp. APG4]NCT91803.1 aldose epimerase [Cellulomonas sp. APG4]
MRDDRVLAIASSVWEVGVLPAAGASLSHGRVRGPDGEWRDLLRPTRAAARRTPWGCSSYVLVPFSNRVRDGVLRWDGRTWQLRPNSPDGNAMHGTGLEYPWRVTAHSPVAVTLELDTREAVGANFPWHFRATVTYALDGPRFTVRTHVRNLADEPFPAGFGHHPFFRRGLVDPALSELSLRLPARAAYPLDAGLPTGPAGPVPRLLDFRELRRLDGELLNDCLVRDPAGGPVRLEWPESGVGVDLVADDVLAHTLVYAPRGRGYVAVEPVTNANDAFNLLADGVETHGLQVLTPGEELVGAFHLDLEHL